MKNTNLSDLCIKKILIEDFPLKFIYGYIFFNNILGITAIVFQILSIVYSVSYYSYGTGYGLLKK